VGVMPLTLHLDQIGPIARSAADLDLVTKVVLHQDDALWSANWEYESPPRLAYCEEYFKDNSSLEVWRTFAAGIKRLRESGLIIEQVDIPEGFETVHAMHRQIMAAEAAAIHRPEYAQNRHGYSSHVSQLIDEGLRMTAVDYAEALFHRHRFSNQLWQWFEHESETIDAILIPATPSEAPTTDSTGDPKFNSPWSYAGTPSATLPIGVTAAGLPIGMQILGAWVKFNEHTLAVAKYVEPIVKSNERPQLLEESR
jgi:aspartyl-tRNA(Asn)/glutamyl-tRNA(Gln) amidotransferase subunit A